MDRLQLIAFHPSPPLPLNLPGYFLDIHKTGLDKDNITRSTNLANIIEVYFPADFRELNFSADFRELDFISKIHVAGNPNVMEQLLKARQDRPRNVIQNADKNVYF